MRLAVSNIAWDTVEDESIARLLKRFAIDAIDIAPGKYFPAPTISTDAEIAKVKNWWADRGIEITGMQALLFGTTGLNVFGSIEVRAALLGHLSAVCRIAGGLGATRVVFGSPKNRDRSGLTDQEVLDISVPFFQRLGDIALDTGVTICLEPNPSCYGANFMTTSAETARVVGSIDHPAIRMQLDTGALTINEEDPHAVLSTYGDLVGHVHASERNLVPLGDGDTDHSHMYSALVQYSAAHVVSIEMVATKEEAHLMSIERAILVAVKNYRPGNLEVNP